MSSQRSLPKTTALAVSLVALSYGSSAVAGTFDGRWVFVQRMTTSASVPVVGDIEATTTVVSMHDLRSDDGRLKGTGTLCDLEVDSGSDLVSTILPAAFRKVLPPPVVDALIDVEGGALQLTQARRTVVVGARLESPESEKLPTKASDSRVIDEDGDGKPGVTVRVEGIVNGSIYVVQRSWTRLDGGFLADGTFGGKLFHGSEQVVLGSTSPFLGSPPKSKAVPDKSWFRIVRLDKDATCKEARRAAKAYL
jgi:hypothetical protein